MDRGAKFEVPPGVLTDRCRAVFDSLDLTQDLCQTTECSPLPDTVVSSIMQSIEQCG